VSQWERAMIRKGAFAILSLLTVVTGIGLFLNSTLGGCKCVRYCWITPDDWYTQVQVQNWSLLLTGQPRRNMQVVARLPVGWHFYRGAWYLDWRPTWKSPGRLPETDWHIRIPLVILVPLFAIYPTLVIHRIARDRRRRKRGLCVACAYDLTGNTSGLCPECGAPIRQGGSHGW